MTGAGHLVGTFGASSTEAAMARARQLAHRRPTPRPNLYVDPPPAVDNSFSVDRRDGAGWIPIGAWISRSRAD